jgi:AraC-like DNA-binding protein
MRIELTTDTCHELLAEAQAGGMLSTELRPWPARLGNGRFGFIDVRPGVMLSILDFTATHDLAMRGDSGNGYFQCSYYLRGSVEGAIEGVRVPIALEEGQSHAGVAPPAHATAGYFRARRPQTIVSICMSATTAMEMLAWDTRRTMTWMSAIERGEPLCEPAGVLRAAQQNSAAQLLDCPFVGSARRLFLESKVLDLLAHEAAEQGAASREFRVSADDEARVRDAARHLVNALDNPPSIRALARTVGINELKLKRGFKTVFGTTVFGYLRQHRLNVARRLLVRSQVSIAEAARQVGYACPSRFASAFRRHYGEPPSELRRVRAN